MTFTIKSKIEKGAIRLPKRVALADGTRVIVKIEPLVKAREKQKIVAELCGAWSSDKTIPRIFEELDTERHQYFGREVRFA